MSNKTNLMVLMLAAVSVATAAVTVVPELINGDFDAANGMQGWRYYDTHDPQRSAFSLNTQPNGNRVVNYIQTDTRAAGEDYGLDRNALDGCPAVSQGDVVQLSFLGKRNLAETVSRIHVTFSEYIDNNADGNPDTFAGTQSGPTDNLFYATSPGVWYEFTTAEYTVQNANTNCLNIIFKYRDESGAFVAGNYAIDTVQFVPEPATIALLGLGAVGMIKRRRA
ncbi:PEP-CTERM motif protein [Limihaloglobus sulfuriphilus]|uniref:PEP-CTERM motif protein n=1 Tax=Limihaloglobus sulfuriphilus TaxID=1851148 RepID=A0A1Q2MIT5_9BACT|nr:PEP-CTERM sorting domain-containing protein [Limihaloglobus sulfuriphilus]AQQ72590.1 PEP-CTERM motif protein [Limihaloglobus sulfuriphilus]